MPPSSSRHLARFAAPAAFLLAVTIAVLLIRSGLGGGSSPAPPATTVRTTTRAHTTPAVTTLPPITATGPVTTTTATSATTSTTPVTTSVPGATYYTVQKGDTFTIIAAKSGTTVAQIEQLNPGVSSNALTVGQQIRVK